MHSFHDQAEADRERLRWLSDDELRSLEADWSVGEILIARMTGLHRSLSFAIDDLPQRGSEACRQALF